MNTDDSIGNTNDSVFYYLLIYPIFAEKYTCLLKLNQGNSGLEALLRKICLLGGPYYRPPVNLWHYLHFFWYDPASHAADGSSVTPEPDCAAPNFQTKFCDQIGNIGMIMDALKEEEVTSLLQLSQKCIVCIAPVRCNGKNEWLVYQNLDRITCDLFTVYTNVRSKSKVKPN